MVNVRYPLGNSFTEMSEGDRVIKYATFQEEFYKLDVWLGENITEVFDWYEIVKLRFFIRGVLDNPFLARLVRNNRILIKAYTDCGDSWGVKFDFHFEPNSLVGHEVISTLTLRSDADVVVASQALALQIALRLQNEVFSSNEQQWQIRTAGGRLYLNIDNQIQLEIFSFADHRAFDRQSTTLSIGLAVHSSHRFTVSGNRVSIGGIVLQANITKQAFSNGGSLSYIEVEPRVSRIEETALNSPIRIWTRPFEDGERSPTIPQSVYPRIDRTADGSGCRVNAFDYMKYVRASGFYRVPEPPEPSRGEIPGCIGDTTCRYNARKPSIRCAVNPYGPCVGCNDYEEINSQE